jgi:hypothetical protein
MTLQRSLHLKGGKALVPDFCDSQVAEVREILLTLWVIAATRFLSITM